MFLFRVAHRLGYPTPRHLLDAFDLTSDELVEIAAVWRVDPTVGHRVDYMHGRLLQAVAAFGGSKKPLKEFLPQYGTPRPKTNEEIMAIFAGLAI